MQGTHSLKLLTATVLLAVALTGCQSSLPTHNAAHMPVLAASSVDLLVVPVPDTGLSVDADSSFAIIELMPFIVGQAEALALTPAQIQVFAEYRKLTMKNRMALQANEKALRGQLRTAIMAGADEATTTALMHRISETEMAHMTLRHNCVKSIRNTLTPEQFAMLIQRYEQTLKRTQYSDGE